MSFVPEALKAAYSAVQRKDWVRAWQMSNAILNEEPERPEALFLMGTTLREMDYLGLALHVLRRALALEQKQPNLWMTYAATLHDLHRYDESREAFEVVHKLIPSDPMPAANIGATYMQQGRWRDCLDWCDKALEIDPENHVARITANFANLSLGRWTDAWRDARYLYGKHLPLRVYNPPEQEEPAWDGTKGQVVVVQADQGVGDIIMFSQMLPQLAADCKEVILEIAPRMVSLMQRTYPGITVVGTLKDEKQSWALERLGTDDQVQAHVHISYLGNWYRQKDADFPRSAYLKVDDAKVTEWRKWLEQFPRPWVGIAWKGGIHATQHHLRSLDLPDFGPIIKSAGTCFDLSYNDSRLEVSRWNIDNREQIVCPPVNVENFENTVALIAALDEIATVTTTVAHVCGALGHHAYVLVPSIPQWRYAYRMDDGGMLWYPKGSVELIRQQHGETGWGHAVERVARAMGRKARKAA